MASPSSSTDSGGLSPAPEPPQVAPRRRLVKASMRAHPEEGSARKREGATTLGSASPGYGGVLPDRTQSASFLPTSAAGLGTASGLPGSIMTSNVTNNFRERDRGSVRSNIKEISGDHFASPSHGGGAFGASKPGRPPHMSSSGFLESRPLGRRTEGSRRHDSTAAQKHGEEIRLQQAKRAALTRAQQAGATGNFKSFDSPFGNFLVPVIPMQFLNKPQVQSTEIGTLPHLSPSPVAGSSR